MFCQQHNVYQVFCAKKNNLVEKKIAFFTLSYRISYDKFLLFLFVIAPTAAVFSVLKTFQTTSNALRSI